MTLPKNKDSIFTITMHSDRQSALVHHDYPIKAFHTFGTDAKASIFAAPQTMQQLSLLTEEYQLPENDFLVIGEGSNMLFTGNYRGILLKPGFRNIRLLSEDDDQVRVQVGASENWDNWVQYALQRGWYGLENLSMIPGSVGASPVQNIGAYGVELKDRFAWLEAWDFKEKKSVRLEKEHCQFGYRSSIFKSRLPGRYMITHVVFNLQKIPDLQLGYGQVREAFTSAGGSTPDDLRAVIMAIRSRKLPDPSDFGNAGSFFKNPVIPMQTFHHLRQEHFDIPGHPAEGEQQVKVPAAWLIEKSGWKGKRLGHVGTWPTQPLVIVNYGGATGQEILDFSEKIRQDIQIRFGITLEREVNVIGSR